MVLNRQSIVWVDTFCRAMPETNSSLILGIGCTSLMAASFLVVCVDLLQAMPVTNSSLLLGLFGTPLEAAEFPRCAMSGTNSSIPGIVVTSLVVHRFTFVP